MPERKLIRQLRKYGLIFFFSKKILSCARPWWHSLVVCLFCWLFATHSFRSLLCKSPLMPWWLWYLQFLLLQKLCVMRTFKDLKVYLLQKVLELSWIHSFPPIFPVCLKLPPFYNTEQHWPISWQHFWK